MNVKYSTSVLKEMITDGTVYEHMGERQLVESLDAFIESLDGQLQRNRAIDPQWPQKVKNLRTHLRNLKRDALRVLAGEMSAAQARDGYGAELTRLEIEAERAERAEREGTRR